MLGSQPVHPQQKPPVRRVCGRLYLQGKAMRWSTVKLSSAFLKAYSFIAAGSDPG
jgi:hypothetical protein